MKLEQKIEKSKNILIFLFLNYKIIKIKIPWYKKYKSINVVESQIFKYFLFKKKIKQKIRSNLVFLDNLRRLKTKIHLE